MLKPSLTATPHRKGQSLLSYKRNHFRVEPRGIVDWLRVIRDLSHELGKEDPHLKQIIPGFIPHDEDGLQFLAAYIRAPRKIIQEGRLLPEEVKELQLPQRIILWYFLRKLAEFEAESKRIPERVNQFIAERIFQQTPLPPVPDVGYACIESDEPMRIDILRNTELTASSSNEIEDRKYKTNARLLGYTCTIDKVYHIAPIGDGTDVCVRSIPVPLEENFNLMRSSRDEDCLCFGPQIILQSSLLHLSQGKRSIHLNLDFSNPSELTILSFEITTEDGWQEIVEVNFFGNGYWELVLPSDFPATQSWPDAIDLEIFARNLPCLKVNLNRNEGTNQLVEATIQVTVEGLQPKVLRNMGQILDPLDSFEPFGSQAPSGGWFAFSHPEFADRSLEEINVTPVWIGKPRNLNQYYQGYRRWEEKKADWNVFQVRRSADGTIEEQKIMEGCIFDQVVKFAPPPSYQKPPPWNPEEGDPLRQPISFRFELQQQAFGHSDYPILMTNYSVMLAAFENRRKPKKLKRPTPVNLPYTPQINVLGINYRSGKVQWKDGNHEGIRIFERTPLGFKPLAISNTKTSEGANHALCLGLENIVLEQPASILFSAYTIYPIHSAPQYDWQYLSTTGWKSLDDRYLLHDGTCGLTMTGLLYFMAPGDLSLHNPEMPSGFYWLRLSYDSFLRGPHPNSPLTEIIIEGIFPNGFPIERDLNGISGNFSVEDLPAESAIHFDDENLEVSLHLPLPTGGGIPKESREAYWNRISSFLRTHRRGITPYSWERLALNRYRFLIFAKCFHREACSNEVKMVVMRATTQEDLRRFQEDGIYPFPSLSPQQLMQMARTMRSLGAPFYFHPLDLNLELKLMNPVFQPIDVVICLRYNNGARQEENDLRLRNALRRLINPWMYSTKAVPVLGNWLTESVFFNAVQNLPYVQTVYSYELYARGSRTPIQDQQIPDHLLVLDHDSLLITSDNPTGWETIGEMIVNENFAITAP